MDVGMDFESAIFSVIIDNIDDHNKRQACLQGVMDCVRRWGAADQLPIPARQDKGSAEQQSGEAPLQQLKSELLPLVTDALTHAKNYSRAETIDCLTKLSEKLLLEV